MLADVSRRRQWPAAPHALTDLGYQSTLMTERYGRGALYFGIKYEIYDPSQPLVEPPPGRPLMTR